MSVEDYGFRLLPRWMRGSWADRIMVQLFGLMDGLVDTSKEAAKCGLVSECPSDALEYHGSARLIERKAGETDASLRLRLVDGWDHWSSSGTKSGLQSILAFYSGCPDLYVYDQVNDHWFDGSTGSFDDSHDANWSRLWVVVEQPHGWTRPLVGGVVVGPEQLVGITMTGSELSRIRRVFRKYRPAHVTGGELFVIFDSTTAASVLAGHGVTSELVRMPLHVTMVGYPIPTVGVLSVGYVYT